MAKNRLNECCIACVSKASACKSCAVKETKEYIRDLKRSCNAKEEALGRACELLRDK